jgi:hypothetical protein
MLSPVRRLLLCILVLTFASPAEIAERPGPPAKPVIPTLPSLTHNAGYIFSGKVKAVERIAPSATDSVPVMRITFQVEKGFRGVRSGQELVIREWASLWRSGDRYRPGQRVMLFLYPPSKLGLTSPVGGELGRFGIDPGGRVIIPRGIPIRHVWPTPRDPVRDRTLMTPPEFMRVLRSAEEE